MAKQLTYNKFQSMPVKVRKSLVCDILITRWNYLINGEGKQREKAYNKALTQFQKTHNLVGNGVICEKTFNALGPIEMTNK